MPSKNLRSWLKPSLGTLFARYFLATMLVQLLIIIGFGFLVTKLYEKSDQVSKLEFMNGTIALLRDRLQAQPPQDWDAQLAAMASRFSYPLKLVDQLPAELERDARPQLRQGKPYLDGDNQLLYATLPGSPRLLALGPLDVQSSDSNWISEDIEVLLIWMLLSGATLGTLLYFSLQPLWKDLLEVRRTAEVFAEGDFSARARTAKSRLFAPLPLAFNSMASRLERQLETRQALSHAIAHEIRTPIARLRFGLTMLEEEEDAAEWQRYRDGMERDLQELEELISTSMEFAKLKRSEVPLHLETIDLFDWFDDLIDLVTPLKPPGLELTLDCAREEGAFDRKLMYIATRNLLLNAFKYAQQQVRMRVYHQGSQLIIEVDDDGCGIPEADREKVFEPFLRLDRSRDRATGGHGLGLSFVRLIAEHHLGHASAGASELGGARFRMIIAQPDARQP
ncbi:two-component sensor histidine kinase [Chromobacterium subtsugae]|uniref:histidine kinase n=1 Tax=Chromobacterium subtsugae TaxID=251747 RepID=A0ABS7FFA5_9NEIS|nr:MULTISPECIES: ATP-binding protein [Chromobacterium]KUM03600.1 two-component sensor protein [Chromobacterium subtsugae]KZE85413.1 two-component sensor protein [Chromobacterium sp. F49]MBW7567629.1 two-component sensor histidine kinase [Chromobacterium subtsugae]MBW8288743.1 two-component sensor histidine kinase [Chromobacterium subtsugae]WSE92345.1 ATP-binding protein [Chromobacterium subtsugae]